MGGQLEFKLNLVLKLEGEEALVPQVPREAGALEWLQEMHSVSDCFLLPKDRPKGHTSLELAVELMELGAGLEEEKERTVVEAEEGSTVVVAREAGARVALLVTAKLLAAVLATMMLSAVRWAAVQVVEEVPAMLEELLVTVLATQLEARMRCLLIKRLLLPSAKPMKGGLGKV